MNKTFICAIFSIFLCSVIMPSVIAQDKAAEALESIFEPLQERPKSKEEFQEKLKETLGKLEQFVKDYANAEQTVQAYRAIAEIYQIHGDNKKAVAALKSCVSSPALQQFEEEMDNANLFLLRIYIEENEEKSARALAAELEKKEQLAPAVARMINILNVVEGKMAPALPEGTKDIEGKTLSLNDYKGKVVLVDFWATWCYPCVMEMPNVISVYNRYKSKGFDILGISLDKDKDKLLDFIKERKMPWRQYYDGQGWDNELAGLYGVDSIPRTILLDKTGKIYKMNLRGPELAEAVKTLLEGK